MPVTSNTKSGGWSTSILSAMRRDPKKASCLAVLLIVMAILWAKLALAGAEPAQAAASAVAAPSNSITSPFNVNPAKARQRLSAGASVAASMQSWLEKPVPLVASRNLFSAQLQYFPMDGSRPTQGSRTGADESFWERLAKSISSEADQQEKKQNLIQNLRQEAGQRQLQTTVMGPTPKALVNGTLVSEGETVEAFRVLKIEPRRIYVEREGIKLEIQMK